MAISKSILTVSGVETNVNTRSGGFPAVLCIHGNSLDSSTFDSLFENPDFADYTIISYDLPGHGASGGPKQPESDYSFEGYSKHLRSLIETLELENFVIVGHSLGGHIALQALSAGMIKGLRGLFLIGTPPLSSLDDSASAFIPLPDGAGLFQESLDASVLADLVSKFSSDMAYQDELKRMILSTKSEARGFMGRNLACFGISDENKTIAELEIPYSVNFGSEDRILNQDYIRKMNFPGARGAERRINILPGVEHIPQWGRGSTEADRLLKFIKKSNGEN